MEVSIFVPGHITGFFSICNNENPLKKGSCGAGVLIDKGVITTIKTNGKKEKTSINITINGKKDPKNEIISKKTISLIQKEFKFKLNSNININHEIQIPIGSGFGTSASCALGVSIGLSKLLKLPLTTTKASQFAHIAEINLGSGLGDVLSQTSKEIVFRKFPGAPGIGKTEDIIKSENDYLSDIYVLTKTFGEIDTSSIIQNPLHAKKINDIGLAMQEKMIVKPTLENFIKLSYEFSKETGLMSREIENIVEELNKKTIGASMAMLGNTVFAFVKKEDINNIKNLNDFTISKIYNNGIKIR